MAGFVASNKNNRLSISGRSIDQSADGYIGLFTFNNCVTVAGETAVDARAFRKPPWPAPVRNKDDLPPVLVGRGTDATRQVGTRPSTSAVCMLLTACNLTLLVPG